MDPKDLFTLAPPATNFPAKGSWAFRETQSGVPASRAGWVIRSPSMLAVAAFGQAKVGTAGNEQGPRQCELWRHAADGSSNENDACREDPANYKYRNCCGGTPPHGAIKRSGIGTEEHRW